MASPPANASPQVTRKETAEPVETAYGGPWWAWIDGNGGALRAPAVGVAVEVPPRAVPAPTEFRLAAVGGHPGLRLSSHGSPEVVAVSPLIALQPSGAIFAKPVSVRLPHWLTDGNMTILVADDDGSNVREMPRDCVTDMAEARVTFQTSHFSCFQAVMLCTADALDSAVSAALSLYKQYSCGDLQLELTHNEGCDNNVPVLLSDPGIDRSLANGQRTQPPRDTGHNEEVAVPENTGTEVVGAEPHQLRSTAARATGELQGASSGSSSFDVGADMSHRYHSNTLTETFFDVN